MNLKEIQDMWKVDCKIDDIELDASSLEVPRLHAKYAELLSEKKLAVIRYERQMKELNKDKWLWYGGKMSRDKIEEHKWDYDPFDGLTVLKSDYDKFTGADKEIQDLNDKLEYSKSYSRCIIRYCLSNNLETSNNKEYYRMAEVHGRLVVAKTDEVYLTVSAEDSIRKELSEFFKFKVPGAEFYTSCTKKILGRIHSSI